MRVPADVGSFVRPIRTSFSQEVSRVRASRLRPWPVYALVAIVTGICLGIAAGLPLAVGDIRPALAALILALSIRWLVVALPPTLRTRLAAILLVALTGRFATAVLLHDASIALGREGFITGDDWNYAELAWGYASYLRGTPYPPYEPPNWNTDAYLFGTYVYLESLVFFVFGRQVLLMEFINAWALILASVVLFDITRRLFDGRAALFAILITVFYPSLFIWSTLNLKDAIALLFITATFWVLLRFGAHPAWLALGLLFVVLYPMQSLRRYVYLLLLLAIALGMVISLVRARATRPRIVSAAAAVLAVVLFVSDFTSTSWFGRIDLNLFESLRQGMSSGARTGFQEPAPIPLEQGDTYVIVATSPSPAVAAVTPATPRPTEEPTPTPSPPPTCTPSTRVVESSAQLVVSTLAVQPSPVRGVVYVCPGDLIIVGADTTPAPIAAQRPLLVAGTARVTVRRNPVGDLSPLAVTSVESLERTLAYLPRGMQYALLAPFPWSIERSFDLLTVPEMLAWYGLLGVAAVSIWRYRRRWADLVPVLVYVVGLVLALSLAEGNYGTLYRHRAMLVPFVVMLATPTLGALWPGREARSQ